MDYSIGKNSRFSWKCSILQCIINQWSKLTGFNNKCRTWRGHCYNSAPTRHHYCRRQRQHCTHVPSLSIYTNLLRCDQCQNWPTGTMTHSGMTEDIFTSSMDGSVTATILHHGRSFSKLNKWWKTFNFKQN